MKKTLKLKHCGQIALRMLLLVVLSAFTLGVQAQVAIGSGEPPVSGAGLQVKEITNVSGGNVNSYRGINFPRVHLTDSKNLYPMFLSNPDDPTSGPASEYMVNKNSIDTEHVGLIVYNIGDAGIDPGIYYWDGEKWEQIVLPDDTGGTGGAMYENFTIIEGLHTIANPYIVQPNDYLLILRFQGSGINGTANTAIDGNANSSTISRYPPYINSTANLILPDPTTCKGRILRLINDTYTINTSKAITVYTNYPMFCIDGTAHHYNDSPNSIVHERDYKVAAGNPIDGSRWCIFSDGANWISMEVTIY